MNEENNYYYFENTYLQFLTLLQAFNSELIEENACRTHFGVSKEL